MLTGSVPFRGFLALVLSFWSGLACAAITLNIEMNPEAPRIGEVIRSQMTVANDGSSNVASVVLRATVPASVDGNINISYMNIAPTGCNTGATSQCDPGDVMTFNLGTLAAGNAATILFPPVVAAGTAAGTVITLSAEVLVSNVQTATAIDSVTVDDDNALTFAIDEDLNGVPSGGTLTYTLTYGNRSINPVTGTTLTVTLPPGATLVSATPGVIDFGGVVAWNLGTLSAGESGRQQLVVALPGTLVNGHVIENNGSSISGTSTVPEAAVAEAVTVVGGGGLGIAVEVNPDPARPNERLRTEITVTNRTGASLLNVVLRARVPDNINSFSPNYTTVTATACGFTGSSACDARDLIVFNLGTLPAGAGTTVSLPPVVANGTADGQLLTWETIVNDDQNVRQSLASHTVAVDNDNALTVAVDENLDNVAPGGNLAYTLTYANRSINPVTGTTLSFPLPAGTALADSGGGTESGGLVTWNLGTLLAGESGRRQISVQAGAGLGQGTLLRVDAGTLSGTGTVPEAARGTAATIVRTSQGLGIVIEADPDPVRSGERLRTTITITNRLAIGLGNVLLQARMPDNLVTFLANELNISPSTCGLTGPSPNCDSGDNLAISLGPVAAGASVSLTLPPIVTNGTGDGVLLVWEAIVTATGNHRALARHAVAVDNGNALTLGLDDSVDPVATGENLTYTLTYGNRGIGTLTGTTLRLPLPPGVTFVSATDGGTEIVANVVEWSLGNLTGGQSGRRQATVSVDGALTGGQLLVVDAASVSGTGAAIEAGRAVAATSVRGSQTFGLAIEANPDPVRQDERLRTEIAVTNRSGIPRANVSLSARVPDGTVSFNPNYSTGTATHCNSTGSSSCDAGELIIYNLGTLVAGEGVVVSIPPVIANGTEDGRLLVWEAIVTADGGDQSLATHHVAVDNDNALTLAADDAPNATPANGVLTYVLTYGNRSVNSVTGANLSFPIPDGTTLLSSTGGTASGNVINFNLGTIGAGQGGRRQLRVQLGGNLPAGSLIYLNGPQIVGTSAVTGSETGRASEVTPVEGAATLPALLVTAQLQPDPAQPGQTLTGTLTVSNNTGADLPSVVVRARVPDFVNGFLPTLLSPAASAGCNITGSVTTCDAGDTITWSVGTLAPGAVTTLTLPPVVTSGGGAPVNGQLLFLYAEANDVGTNTRFSTAADTALIGVFTDSDTDQIPQIYDNCLNVANPDQRDTNFDGFGNVCDADLNNSLGLVNFADLALFRGAFGTSGTAASADADFNGSGGLVNFADLALFRSLFGQPPGPSALAP